MAATRDLLFGLLALQNGMVTRDQLVAAFGNWTGDKSRSLADHLITMGHLGVAQRGVIEALADLHVEAHGGDAERSLAAIPAARSARCSLAGLDDHDLAASLAVLAPFAEGQTQAHRSDFLSGLSRITLADTEADEGVTLAHVTEQALDGAASRYEFMGEIARGGMGAVFKARDPGLGRELALKILLDCHRDRIDLVDRFVDEAQICGQLQHPGVVPVYELGTLADDRPFFTMKLVKGRTLAALLEERIEPDLPRFLTIFEAVCQTVAYAHARGVIHRDLKPSNVMVGSFGEVQVMDWGLAKVLPREGQAAPKEPEIPSQTVVATLRSTGDSDLSQAGSVLGTPAYMAPEQARGDMSAIDRRADVFALGSILCEILTGEPAFTGVAVREILAVACRGETAGALARLAACQADAELLDMARDCLAADRNDRPPDAGAVASRMTAYLAGVQERLRAAELARVAETARASEAEAKVAAERRVRRLTGVLAATVVLAGGVAGATWRWIELQRLERSRQATDRVNMALREATRMRGLAQGAALGDAAPWAVAAAASEKARDLLEPGVDQGLRKQVEELAATLAAERAQAEAGAESERHDRRLLDSLVEIRSAEADDRGGWRTDAAYAEAFRTAGFDASGRPPDEVGAAIRVRPLTTAVALAAAIDDWAAVRRDRKADRAGAAALAAMARAADPDPWRNSLRDALDRPDRNARRASLRKLAGAAPLETLGPISLDLLGRALANAGDPAGAVGVLQQALRRHPGDVWINFDLAGALEMLSRRAEAIRYYIAARALRPETAHELGHALDIQGEGDAAIAVFEGLRRLRPDNGRHLGCLAVALKSRGRSREASAILETAIAAQRAANAARPNDSTGHYSLGFLLSQHGKVDEAIAAYRAVLRIQPEHAGAHTQLGSLLQHGKKDFAGAEAEFRAALRLRPDDAFIHTNFGVALAMQGKLEESITEYRAALRIGPDVAATRVNLGMSLYDARRDYAGAEAEYRAAIRIQPDYAVAYVHLGLLLCNRDKDYARAADEFRVAVRLQPDDAGFHSWLAWALISTADLGVAAEALQHARKAVSLEPNNGHYFRILALAEYRAGRFAESIAAAERSTELSRPAVHASNLFVQAMAYGRRGEASRARGFFDQAVAWTREKDPNNGELLQYWREGATLLGRPAPDAPGAARLPSLPDDVFAN